MMKMTFNLHLLCLGMVARPPLEKGRPSQAMAASAIEFSLVYHIGPYDAPNRSHNQMRECATIPVEVWASDRGVEPGIGRAGSRAGTSGESGRLST